MSSRFLCARELSGVNLVSDCLLKTPMSTQMLRGLVSLLELALKVAFLQLQVLLFLEHASALLSFWALLFSRCVSLSSSRLSWAYLSLANTHTVVLSKSNW